MPNGKAATLDDVYEELRIHNRLTILSLVKDGIRQKDLVIDYRLRFVGGGHVAIR